jgi:membrane protein YdbS with pleckstrin-like domain
MTMRSDYRRRSGISRIIGILVIVWLIVGAIAAGQRGYYGSAKSNCASFATIAVTILAGPLNYVGVNPKVHCKVPEPSK